MTVIEEVNVEQGREVNVWDRRDPAVILESESRTQHPDERSVGGLAISLERLEAWVEWVPIGWQRLYLDMRCSFMGVNAFHFTSVCIHEPVVVDGGLVLDVDAADPVVRGIIRKAWARSRCTCMRCGRPGRLRRAGEYRKTLCARCWALQTLCDDLDACLHDPLDGDPLQLPAVWPLTLSPITWRLIKEGARRGALSVDRPVAGEGISAADQAWLREVWDRVQTALDDPNIRGIR